MWLEHLKNAGRSLRRSPVLSALMVGALGLGVGICMTTLTVYHVLSADPIPGKGEQLYEVQIDAGSLTGYKPGEEPTFQLTRDDGEALLAAAQAKRQALMTGAFMAVRGPDERIPPEILPMRQTSADFFAMFNAPIAEGAPWNAQDDQNEARVAVISHALNQRLFGGANPVGQSIQVAGNELRVVGVLKPWKVDPYVFDLTLGAYGREEMVFMPFSTARALKLGRAGNMNCWGDTGGKSPLDRGTPCAWLQFWVELDTPDQAQAYRHFLLQYSAAQQKAGRFQREPNVRLRKVPEVMAFREVLPADVRLQTGLAFAFLLVCLVNMVGLQLAKTLRRSGEIGVRRALGARRATVFAQFLVESALIGLLGAGLGLLLALGGLWLVRQGPTDYANLAQLDGAMLVLTLGLSLLASLLAGALPAWRATQMNPAIQLKVQ